MRKLKDKVIWPLRRPRARPLTQAVRAQLTDPPLTVLEGGYVVPHFDGKGEVMDYIKGLGINATFVLVSFYFENFLGCASRAGPPAPTRPLTLPAPRGRSPSPRLAQSSRRPRTTTAPSQ